MKENVIVNNTVLSNFAFVDRLDTLKELFEEVFLTPEIQYEVKKGIKEGHSFQKRTLELIEQKNWLLITNLDQKELKLFEILKDKIDIGEASGIAVAKSRKWIFLTDDKNARKEATRLKVRISGTVGILISASDENLISIDEANELLQAMRENKYYSPVSRI